MRSRVCNLREFRPNLTVPMMRTALRGALETAFGEVTDWAPTEAERKEIAVYYEKHSSWQWRMGQTPQFDIELDNRFPWGGVQMLITLNEGRVADLQAYSDALDVGLPGTAAWIAPGSKVWLPHHGGGTPSRGQ